MVGREGMGKSRLVREYFERLKSTSARKVGKIRFEIPRDWPPETYFRELMGRVQRGIPAKGKGSIKDKWIYLGGVFSSRFEKGLQFLFSKENPAPPQDRFLSLLRQAANKLDHRSRLVVILDPNKYLHPESVHIFKRFACDLPEGVKFIIPQRAKDVLISDHEFLVSETVQVLSLGEIHPDDRDDLYRQAVPNEVFQKGLADDVKGLCGGWPILVEDIGKLLGRAHDVEKAFREVRAQETNILGVQSRVFESLLPAEEEKTERPTEYKYQVALSFAGEDRAYAGRLAELLIDKGVSVFYDRHEQAELWGRDLYQHLQRVYRDQALFCVVFLSRNYVRKLWTRYELQQAQARAFREHREYILPVRLDDTDVPGIVETTGYIHLRTTSLERIAELLVTKLSLLNPEYKQYTKERWAIYRMSILSRAQDKSLLADYLGVEPRDVDNLLTSEILRDVIKVTEDEGVRKYQLYHQTFNEYVKKRLEQGRDIDIGQLHKEAAAAFYKAIERNRNDAEALTEYTYHLKESGDRGAFIVGLDKVKGDKDRIGLYRQLKEELTEALTYEELGEDFLRKGSFLNDLGLVNRCLGNLDDSLNAHEGALEIMKMLEHLQGQAAQYGNIGLILRRAGDLEVALQNAKMALEINRRIGYAAGMAANYGNLGLVVADKGDLEGALENHRKALKIDEKIGNPLGMAQDYGNIGNVVYQKGDLEGALENHKKALELNQKIGRPEEMANSYGNIGLVLHQKGDLVGAFENHKKALEIDEKIGKLSGMAEDYGNIGLVLAAKGDLEGALENYNKAVDIFEGIGQPASAAHGYINIATIHCEKNDYKAAALLQLRALLIYSQIGMKPNVEKAQHNLAISVRKLKEQDKFEEFLREAKEKFGEEVEQRIKQITG